MEKNEKKFNRKSRYICRVIVRKLSCFSRFFVDTNINVNKEICSVACVTGWQSFLFRIRQFYAATLYAFNFFCRLLSRSFHR